MAAEVTAVHDRGFATIRNKNGHPVTVNVFELSVSFNQAAPEPLLCFCAPHYKDSVAKSMSRLTWITTPREQKENLNDKGEHQNGQEEKQTDQSEQVIEEADRANCKNSAG